MIEAVIGLVLQQAHQAGVPLDVGHYAFVPAKTGGVGRYVLALRLYDTPVGLATRAGPDVPMPSISVRGCA